MPRNTRKYLPFLLGGVALALQSGEALAQPDPSENSIEGSVVAGGAIVPDYEGSNDFRFVPLAGGRVQFDQRYIALEGLTLRANILASDNLEFGAVANFSFGRDDDVDSAAVGALPEIDASFELGAFAAYSMPVGERGRARIALEAVQDVSSVHNGWVATGSIGYDLAIDDRLGLGIAASASYANDDYAATYFGVTPAGSLASGLPAFDAEGGFKDVGVALSARYQLSDRWSLLAFGGYSRLLGDFAESPIVAIEGSADQFSGGIGVALAF